MKKISISIVVVIVLSLVAVFYFRYQVLHSHGSNEASVVFKIEKGDSNKVIGERLEKQDLIAEKYYFYYYMWSRNLTARILPDEYEITGALTIPEIATLITSEKDKTKKITFPEGWTVKQMAARLTANDLLGDEFLKLADNPEAIRSQYEFLADAKVKTLEGYLFPETYFFTLEMDAELMVRKMLGIFNTKVTSQMRADALKNGRSLNDIVIMASIIEGEVRSDEDRKIVSGIFWDRLKNRQALESCATLAYALGEKKKQYTANDTQINSPYNTYQNKGLPPAPISNPGLSAISAAIYPTQTDYNYFLSDPETGKTIFSVTYEEHVANKAKYGL